MASEDICIVCAEPLVWTAYGSCGHKDTCSQCVTRLRSVLKDERCVYCQQQLPCVFVTRFMGDYTRVVPAAEFETLKDKAAAGEVQYLDSAQAYFDDSGHFQEISSLCSYTHPKVWEEDPGGRHRTFRSLHQLKQHLNQHHGLQFCGICLEGRKVFLAEQCVYTKAELDRHMKSGDLEGVMAESGFKGHPECRFCRKRYYGENELYTHMHTGHEQCFLCKRANPNRFVYYRDYPDLENHFRHEHFLCQHPSCLEKKFVVFNSQQELKQHCAREHGGEMTKAEKKQALTIPVNFSYRRGEAGGASSSGGDSSSTTAAAASRHAAHELAAAAALGRGITIGGGAAAAPSRFARRGGRAGAQQDTVQAIQASLETAQAERSLRHSASQPNLQQGSAPAGPPEAQQGAGGALNLSEAEFPLPVGASGGGGGAAVGGRWAGAASSGVGGGALRAEDFPALPGMSKAAKKKAKGKKSLAQVLGGGGSGSVRVVNVGARGIGAGRDDFPTLRQSTSTPSLQTAAAGVPPAAAPEPEPEWQEVAPPRLSQRQQAAQQKLEAKHSIDKQRAGRACAAGAAAAPPPSQAPPAAAGPGAARPPSPAQQGGGGREEGAGAAGVSESLKAANKALISRIKRLTDASQFATFRQLSMEWMKGGMSSRQYHQQVTSLGLLAVVPDLAATCPDERKRTELLEQYQQACQDGAVQGAPQGGSWVPPEAAAAAAAHAELNSSWPCGVCTLLNGPGTRTCEACGHPKPRPGQDADNQWRGGERDAAGGGAHTQAPEDDPTLPRLQQQAGFGKGKKGRGSGVLPDAAPPAPRVSFSVAATKATATSASAPQTGNRSSAGTPREEDFPSLGGFPSLATSSNGHYSGVEAGGSSRAAAAAPDPDIGPSAAAESGGGRKKGGKPKKQPKHERLRLMGGDPATREWFEQESRKVHPQNAWTQGVPPTAATAVAPQARGPWAGKSAGKLAQQERALLDAWGKK